MEYPAGRLNSLLDIAGLRVGQYDRRDTGYLTGTTVLLAPPHGMVAGVDVRGGAPGTRETDLLHPHASMQRIQAITLTGGSAYGLSAACGVADALGAAGIGFAVGTPGEVVPIVPAAVLFDLGRGGNFAARPDPEFGRKAVAAALAEDRDLETGGVGAGTGAVASGLKGGLGTASAVLPDGSSVAALVVCNAAGSPVDPRSGDLLGARIMLEEDFPGLSTPTRSERESLMSVVDAHRPSRGAPMTTHTSIGVVATNATLTKAQCSKMAATAHDGLARALNPVHTQFDGDTLFSVSTATGPVPDELAFHHILCAASDVVTRALVRGLLAASTVQTSAGRWPAYLDLAPSAGAR